ncbi:MAG: phage recombination protein Bet [Burkholderiales bacterium]
MTTELTVRDRDAGEVVITSEQIDIIKNTVCREATDAEMQLYFYDCKRRGVHPLDRMIHFTKRGGRYVPITSIDFFYQRAHATEQFAGQDETAFKGQPCTAGFEATVRVYRQRPGCEKAGWSATARWSEYYPGDAQGHMWKKMPNRMLEKCAEALALRKAFPAELQGLYVKEEMDQSVPPVQVNPVQPPAPPAASTKGATVLNKMKGKGNGTAESKPAEPSSTVSTQEGAADQVEMKDGYPAAWLSNVLDAEDYLRGSEAGSKTLRAIREGFKLTGDQYPMLPDHQAEYLDTVQRSAKRLGAK